MKTELRGPERPGWEPAGEHKEVRHAGLGESCLNEFVEGPQRSGAPRASVGGAQG